MRTPRRATNGQPTAWASSPRTSPKDAVSGRSRATIEWAATPAKRARAAGSRNACGASAVPAAAPAGRSGRARAGGAGGGPRPRTTGWRGRCPGRAARRAAPGRRVARRARRRSPSIDRSSMTAGPRRAGARAARRRTNSTPCAARSRVRKKARRRRSGRTAEQTSWRKPGSVSSSVASRRRPSLGLVDATPTPGAGQRRSPPRARSVRTRRRSHRARGGHRPPTVQACPGRLPAAPQPASRRRQGGEAM